MENSVVRHILAELEGHRIVVWRDPEAEHKSTIDETADVLSRQEVKLIRVENNELWLLHHVLRDEPKQKFVLYCTGPIPADSDNWLLFLEVSETTFVADRSDMIRRDLKLDDPAFTDVIENYSSFFANRKLRDSLVLNLTNVSDPEQLQATMVQTLVKAKDRSMLEITRALLVACADDAEAPYAALEKYGLTDFHWQGARRIYRYEPRNEWSVPDFAWWMFERAWEGFRDEDGDQLLNLQRDFSSWRDSRSSQEQLRKLALIAEEDPKVRDKISTLTPEEIGIRDMYREADCRVIAELAESIEQRTTGEHEVASIINDRRKSVWFDEFVDYYAVLECASSLLSQLSVPDLTVTGFSQGFTTYLTTWYRYDQLYRQFHASFARTTDAPGFHKLRERVEKVYLYFENQLADSWQACLDSTSGMYSPEYPNQREFFERNVQPTLNANKKIVVIISDALRYEVAEELCQKINSLDRFTATLDAQVGVLPSCTPIGMASLLPHKKLRWSDDGQDVLVDGRSSRNTKQRSQILADHSGVAYQATDILSKDGADMKELFKQHHVFYVYHDVIDAEGDKAATEHKTPQAAEDAIEEIIRLIKKWTTGNASNLVITADHGFLFQNDDIEESDRLSVQAEGQEILRNKRRYVIGRGLNPNDAFNYYTAQDLKLTGDMETLIPKGNKRIIQRGAGNRFVHGGAALQEIVVPVLHVNKGRQTDVSTVGVELSAGLEKISGSQHTVTLIQSEPVSPKKRAARIRVGLYDGSTLMSDQQELTLSSTAPEKKDRQTEVILTLTQDADKASGATIYLVVEKWRETEPKGWTMVTRSRHELVRKIPRLFDF